MEEKITICKICEYFNIKQFNLLYKELNNNNINPLNITKTELSFLIFKSNKNISSLENIKILTKKEFEKSEDFKVVFFKKYLSLSSGKEILKKQKEKDTYEKEINIILKSLNEIREREFKIKSNFKYGTSNIKLITKWLKKGYTIEDFISVHLYVSNLYKSNSNKKIKDGFYFKPSTLYNNKFESRYEESQNIQIENEKNYDEEILIILKELNDIRKNTFSQKYLYEFNENNKEIIKSKLANDYKLLDILNMFKYIEKLYLENDNEKVRSGVYFRPNTLFNKDFPSRIENSISYYNEIDNLKTEEESIIDSILNNSSD